MPTYGFELRITAPGMAPGSYGVRRVEFTAPDRGAANAMVDGWAAVEGKTVVSRKLIADGETLAEAGRRIATNYAAYLATEYGGAVSDPIDTGDGGVSLRMTLPDGKGISFKVGGSLAYDPAPTIEALAFDRSGFIGDSVRSVDMEACLAMMDDLTG